MLYLAVVLDAATFGKYVFITTTCAIVPLFAGLGTEHVLIMEASRSESLLPVQLGNALAVRAPVSLALIGAGVLVVLGWDFDDPGAWFCIWFGSIVAAISNPLLMAVYRITSNYVRPWIYLLTGTMILLVLVVAMGKGITLLTVAIAFAGAHLATLTLFAFDIRKRTTIRLEPQTFWKSFRSGIIFAASQACDFIFARLDIFLVQALCGSRALGVYSIGQKIVSMLQLIPASVNIVELPEFHRAASDLGSLTLKFRVMRRALTEIGTIAFGLLALNAKVIISSFFSDEYQHASEVLMVLCAGGLILFANYPYYMLAEAIRAIRARLSARIVTTVGTAVAVAAGVKMLGVVGAAYGVLLGQLIFMLLLHKITKTANGGMSALISDTRLCLLGVACLLGSVGLTSGLDSQPIRSFAASSLYVVTFLGGGYQLRWTLLVSLLARGRTSKAAPS
ncbi:MAG: oligosaccharide flippase family protein [Verrucomicrobia bacterium]|nr:oligosaccharide flippase family protein [Verrucomicrobiota bacterium]